MTKYLKPLAPETLCAIRTLLKDDRADFLDDLLWGEISLSVDSHTQIEWDFAGRSPETILNPPILAIAEICEANDLAEVLCHMQLTDDDILLLQELVSMDLDLESRAKNVLLSIVESKNEYRSPQHVPLFGAHVTSLLRARTALVSALMERDAAFSHFEGNIPFLDYKGYVRKLMRMRPIQIDTGGSLRELGDAMDGFITDFRKDKVKWAETGRNVLVWELQKQILVRHLESLVRDVGNDFLFVPYSLAETRRQPRGFRSTATLFGLEQEVALRILEVRRFEQHGLQFRIEYLQPLTALLPKELLKTAEESAKVKRTVGKKATVKFRTRGDNFVLVYKDEEYIPPKNTRMAKICGKLYSSCQHVGSTVTPNEVYDDCYPSERKTPYSMNQRDNWLWVYHSIGSLQTWADRKGLPPLFKCTVDVIKRMA